MSDVSGKITLDLIQFAQTQGYDSAVVFAELSDILNLDQQATKQALENIHQEIPWQAFVMLCKNISKAHGDDNWAHTYANWSFAKSGLHIEGMRKLAGFIAEPKWFYWACQKWLAPKNVRNFVYTYEDLGNNKLSLGMQLKEGYEDFPFMYWSGKMNLEKFPLLLGLPAATIDLEIQPRNCIYNITLPPSLSILSRLRRALWSVFSTRSLIKELATQDHILRDNYNKLIAANTELQQARNSLEQRVTERTKDLQETVEELEIAKATLKLNQSRLLKAQEIAGLGYWDWQLTTNEIFWSDQVYSIYSLPMDEKVTYEKLLTMVFEDDLKSVTHALNETINAKVPQNLDFRIITPNGTLRYVHTQAEIIVDAENRVTRLSGIVLDITERKLTELRLIESKDAADEANRAKSAFLANMSHELRTPLGAVLGFSELMSNPHLPEDQRIKFAEVVNRNGKNLVSLINEILDVAKIEAKNLDTLYDSCNPWEVLAQVVELLSPEATRKNIFINLSSDTNVGRYILTDQSRMTQILTNMIGNAIKFTESGAIDIYTEIHPNEMGGHFVSFLITDTGKGISTENQKKLFEPFSQEDISTTKKYGGTGLGLYLSKKIANLLGGDVTLVCSEKNKGSTFQVKIRDNTPDPLSAKAINPSPEISTLSAPKSSLSGKHVLLVEDYPDNQILVSAMLAKTGCVLRVVGNGSEGLSEGRSNAYDLILMDMQLPEIDGFSVTKTLRSEQIKAPIIALTAFASKKDRERCIEAGCTEFISKPLDSSKLIAVMESCVAKY